MPEPTEPIYCTAAELRAEIESNDETVDDGVAKRTIETAEDLIDRMLGGWWLDGEEFTGRKIRQQNIEDWQWAKLTRATVKLAARLYRDPSLLEQSYESVRGPDFSMTGPKGAAIGRIFGVQVLAILDESGLRRIAGHARAGRRRPVRGTYLRFLERRRFPGQ